MGDPGATLVRGAYGLRVTGLEEAADLLLEVEPDWPELSVRWVRDDSPPPPVEDPPPPTSTAYFWRDRVVLDLGASGTIEVERSPVTATFRIRAARNPHAVVHPYLGGAASVVARWLGREAFHAGAFVHGSRAWGVLGHRTAGKSSVLGWLHAHGHPVLADDVLVVERGRAFAAPRVLDLREDTSAQLELGEPLGRVGARERWRVRLGAVPLSVPLAGFVFLDWGDGIETRRVTGRDRLERLTAALTTPEQPTDPATFLDLAALPVLELRRPRDWGAVDAAATALLRAIAGEPDRLEQRQRAEG